MCGERSRNQAFRSKFFPHACACAPLPGTDRLEMRRDRSPRYRGLGQLGLECTRSDAGDPWCAVYDQRRDIVVLHIAQIDQRYERIIKGGHPPWNSNLSPPYGLVV